MGLALVGAGWGFWVSRVLGEIKEERGREERALEVEA